MKTKFSHLVKRFVSSFLAAVMAFSLIVPNGALTVAFAADTETQSVPTNTYEIEVGESITLQATDGKTTWKSQDTSIATVTSQGVVTGVCAGTTTVTATTISGFFWFLGWGTKTTTTYAIIVTSHSTEQPDPDDTSDDAQHMKVGETLILAVSGWNVRWSSSDISVATVSSKGVVTGIAPGRVTITATSGFSFFCWNGETTTEFRIVVDADNSTPVEPDEPSITTYTVTFDSNGGSAVEPQVVEEGMTAAKPEDPTLDGYAFEGWYSDTDLTSPYDFATPVTDNITLYAKWETVILTCTVIFQSNGGSNVEAQVVKKGATATKPEDPTKEGYTFAGWYIDSEFEHEYDFETLVNDDIVLYAKWTENGEAPSTTYTVSFETNGGSEVPNQAIYAGNCAYRPENPTKEGYVFDDWYSDSALTEKYDFATAVTSDITLYAKWSEMSVIITIDTGSYGDYVVNRTVSGSITANTSIISVSYSLEGEYNSISEDIELSADNTFEIDVLLQGGTNILTVTATTADGSTTAKSVEMQYDSGEAFDIDDDRLILKTLETDGAEETDSQIYYVTNLLSLYFTDGTSFEDRESFAVQTLGGTVVGYLNGVDLIQIALPDTLMNTEYLGYSGETAVNEISANDLQSYADLISETYDQIECATIELAYSDAGDAVDTQDPWDNHTSTNSALSDEAWWIDDIDANDAWEYDSNYNSDYLAKIKLGTVDEGFQSDHPDLESLSVISKEDSPSKHGTHVSGIMAATADNGVGIAGIMHNNATLYGYDVGHNILGGTISYNLTGGVTKLVESGAKIINVSMGTHSHDNLILKITSSSAKSTMKKLLSKGYDFIIVQSAGNDGDDYQYNSYFCAISSADSSVLNRILIVSNTDQDHIMVENSNGGDVNGPLNLIAAPGYRIYSCITNSKYDYLSGTSMSAPVVSAVCGLTWSVNPMLTGADVVRIVMESTEGTARTNPNSKTTGGMGIVNANNSVQAAIETLPVYYGYVVDATTGDPILATIKVHKGNANGVLVGADQAYYTDSTGKFTLPKLPLRSYTLEISADGYVTAYSFYAAMCPAGNSNTINLGTIGLSPVMDENEYRIVLRWSGEPSDLDSHLVATTANGDAYHVYFSNQNPSPEYANLDLDDTSYEGPETITITNFSELRNIRYAVHDYTNRNSSSSTVLSSSGAYVEVYKGNTLLNTFYVPTNIGGTEWDVFAIDANGTIIPTNQMVYCSAPDNVLSGTSSTSEASVMAASIASEKP